MKEIAVPSSPNWYLSQVLDCSETGKIAYGSKDSIVLLFHENDSFTVIPSAHKERVTSVKFAPASAGNKLVSSGDDHVVRIWNLDSRQAALANIVHASAGHTPIATWSYADANLVVSADSGGYLVLWDLLRNLTRTFHFKLSFTAIACCLHKRDLVAIGTKTGLVCIMDISGKGRVVHKLRGHDVEVTSLAWCPVSDNIFKPQAEEMTCLLASGARDTTIYLWRAATDGRYEKSLHLPTEPSAGSGHRAQLSNTVGHNSSWTCVCWPEPKNLLAASPWGELIAYDLLALSDEAGQVAGRMANRKMKGWRLLHGRHARGLFSIACQPRYRDRKTESDWRASEEREIWTIAQDRLVVSCSLTTGEISRSMTTLGGPVYCMALSPIDGSRLAIGVGDKTIRLWNLSNPDPDSMVMLWNKIAGKVYSLAWHPSKEGWLAYGTSDGRIGIYDTMSNKPPMILRMFFNQPVYVLAWGPQFVAESGQAKDCAPVPGEATQDESEVAGGDIVPAKTSAFLLYALAEGLVVAYDPAKADEKPVNLKEILRAADEVAKIKLDKNRTGIAWKPDYSLVAVGNEDGSVHLLAPSRATGLRHVQTVLVHSRLIQDLSWHPVCCGDDVDLSPRANWLAVSSNDSVIRVIDTTNLLVNLTDSAGQTDELLVPVIANLKGHHSRVATLSWNTHTSGQLLSTSYDESAVIWDVASQEALCHFSGHCGVVLCGLWHPLEPDFALTGSSDVSVRMWQISAQKEGPSKAKKKKKAYQGGKNALPDDSFDTGASEPKVQQKVKQDQEKEKSVEVAKSEEALLQERAKIKDRSMFPKSGPLLNESSNLLKNLQIMLVSEEQSSKNGETTAVEKGNSESSQSACTDDRPEGHLASAFFGDKEAIDQLLEKEQAALLSSENFEAAFALDVWRCKIKEAVEEATKNHRLTDQIVALCPMASMRLWQSACLAYAEQLRRTGDYIRSAGYYLAVHKVEEAVNMLMEHNLCRQAVAIAKSRFLMCDPFVKGVMVGWAKQKSQEGQFELAANCLASVGEWIDAAEELSRRTSATALSIAAQLAARGGAEEKGSRFFMESLRASEDQDWGSIESSLTGLSNQNHLKFLVAVYKLVLKNVDEAPDPAKWLKGEANYPLDLEFNVRESYSDRPVSAVVETGTEVVVSKQLHLKLKKLQGGLSASSSRVDALLTAAINLALAMTCAPKCFTCLPKGFTCPEENPSRSDVHEAVRKLVQAMAALNDYQLRNPDDCDLLMTLCILLSPKGPNEASSIFAEASEVSPAQRSCRAYLCTGVLSWLMGISSSLLPATQEVDPERRSPLKARRRHVAEGDSDVKTTVNCQSNKPAWAEALDLLQRFGTYLFSSDNMKYFSASVRLKVMVHLEANATIKEQRDTLDTKVETLTRGVELVSIDSDNNTNAERVKEEQSGVEKTKQTEVAEGIVESHGDHPAITERQLEIRTLREWFSNFEEDQVKVPNPFVCYSNLSLLLKETLTKADEKKTAVYTEYFKNIWDEAKARKA